MIIVVLILLITRLVDLQIVNGEDYRNRAERKLVRTTDSYAVRGEILDRNGVVLATSRVTYSLELYKTKKSSYELNQLILKIIEILDKNNDTYLNNFPIDLYTNTVKLGDTAFENWKKDYNFSDDITVEGIIEYFIEKYNLQEFDDIDKKRLLPIRYELANSGYTAYRAITIAKDISSESVHEIQERNHEISGVYISTQSARVYPQGKTLSHIVGYTGNISDTEYASRKELGYKLNDTIGKSGIERSFEEYLRGKNGKVRLEMDTNGIINNEEEIEESKMGDSIYLTVDTYLQEKTEEALEKIVKEIHDVGINGVKYKDAKTGSAVVLDVKTGEVLAIASYPDYNLQDFADGISNEEYQKYFNDDTSPMFNRAIQGLYPPGSTFKMVSAIAALESGVVSVNEKILDKGIYNKGHKPACWLWNSRRQTHGYVNAMTALKVSCNYYFYEVGSRMGIDKIAKYAKKFGLGEKTGIEVYGESKGTVSSREYIKEQNEKGAKLTWGIGDTLSSSIGQSYNLYTPLQMAYYISTIANKGKRTDLTIIKKVESSTREELDVETIRKEIKENVGASTYPKEDVQMQDSTINAIFEGMRSVTGDRGGTVYGTFNSFDFEVAGKTGTASSRKRFR